MRGVQEGPTRICKVCGVTYARKEYGWCYGACCSHACQQKSHGDYQADPRQAERTDCIHHRRCFDEAAAEPREYVCKLNCDKYEQATVEVKRAKGELHSAAWMWSEA